MTADLRRSTGNDQLFDLASLSRDMEAQGRILWDIEGGHLHSMSMEANNSEELEAAWVLEAMGQEIPPGDLLLPIHQHRDAHGSGARQRVASAGVGRPMPLLSVPVLTGLTLVCFAANSVIGRQGLLSGDIGAGSFALARLVSGALFLLLLCGPRRTLRGGDWPSALALAGYALCFSYAYLRIDAGAGALILFAVVQVTMLGAAHLRGDRLGTRQALGLLLAMGALAYWLWPSAASPDPLGTLAMAAAGVGWGLYSLLGLGGGDPVQRTAGNFWRGALLTGLVLPLLLLQEPEPLPGLRGLGWAVLTGAVTSGLGYVLWYAALKGLRASQASIAQLTVPVLAALGGILFLGEPVSLEFTLVAAAVLLGVAMALRK